MANLFDDLRDTAAADAKYAFIGVCVVCAPFIWAANWLWEPLGMVVLCISVFLAVIASASTYWNDWSKGYRAGKSWIDYWSKQRTE